MSFRAKTLGPPARLALAWLAVGTAKTSRIRARGKPTATMAAAASHLTTGLLLASGTGGNHRDLCAPGAQPMQTAHLTSRKTPKVANDDLWPVRRRGRSDTAAGCRYASRHQQAGREGGVRSAHLPRAWRIVASWPESVIAIAGPRRLCVPSGAGPRRSLG